MKTVLLTLTLMFSFMASAGIRQVTLRGDDATNLQTLFKDLGKMKMVGVVPMYGVTSLAVFEFLSMGQGFLIRCTTINPGANTESACKITLDPALATSTVKIENRDAASTEATMSDSDIVTSLAHELKGSEFVSRTKAADGSTPLLRVACQDQVLCRMTLTN